jgi:Tol biopolymer transport system component
MSRTDRPTRSLPDLLDALAPPRVPDYFDDMLQATARTRQRPAWTSLERLLPMQLADRSAPLGLPSWRPLVLLVALVGLVLALAATFLAGGRPTLPPEFGPARNGLVIFGNETGDLMSVDPATGKTTVVIGGPTHDFGPYLSPDGRTNVFVRTVDGVDMLYTANVDGSGVKVFAPAKDAGWNEWSPDSLELVYIAVGGGTPYIRNVATGAIREVPVAAPVNNAKWLSSTKLLLVTGHDDQPLTYSTINVDGTDQRALSMPDACCSDSLLRDRGLLAWTSWNLATGMTGRIHILDIAARRDSLLASTDDYASNFLDPVFSPDGNWLAVTHAGGPQGGVRAALIAADGSGTPLDLEPHFNTATPIRPAFSPDGTKLLVTYGDGSTWLYSVPDGHGAKVDWPAITDASWQRLAP